MSAAGVLGLIGLLTSLAGTGITLGTQAAESKRLEEAAAAKEAQEKKRREEQIRQTKLERNRQRQQAILRQLGSSVNILPRPFEELPFVDPKGPDLTGLRTAGAIGQAGGALGSSLLANKDKLGGRLDARLANRRLDFGNA